MRSVDELTRTSEPAWPAVQQWIRGATRAVEVSDDLDRFYDGSRWAGWRDEIREVAGDHGISVYPFLWAKGPPIAERSRRPVPISELWALQQKFRAEVAYPT